MSKMGLMALLAPYVSGDDVVLSKLDFLIMVRDRIDDDLRAAGKVRSFVWPRSAAARSREELEAAGFRLEDCATCPKGWRLVPPWEQIVRSDGMIELRQWERE